MQSLYGDLQRKDMLAIGFYQHYYNTSGVTIPWEAVNPAQKKYRGSPPMGAQQGSHCLQGSWLLSVALPSLDLPPQEHSLQLQNRVIFNRDTILMIQPCMLLLCPNATVELRKWKHVTQLSLHCILPVVQSSPVV